MDDDELLKSQVLVRVRKGVSALLSSSVTAIIIFSLGFLLLSVTFFPSDTTAIQFSLWDWHFSVPSSLLLALLLLLLFVRYRRQVYHYEQSDLELQAQINEAQKEVIEQPNKARPTWQVASYTLERYYQKNIFQNGLVFGLSVSVIIVGFVLIVYALYLALSDPSISTIAIAGGIAGIITEVIGASCLLIFKSTVEQSLRYATILERTSTIGMALAILDTISIEDNQKTEEVTAAKIEIATKLITQVPSIN